MLIHQIHIIFIVIHFFKLFSSVQLLLLYYILPNLIH